MFIRVVQLININTNNSYVTTLQELSVCVLIETISVSVKTQSTPAPTKKPAAVIATLEI